KIAAPVAPADQHALRSSERVSRDFALVRPGRATTPPALLPGRPEPMQELAGTRAGVTCGQGPSTSRPNQSHDCERIICLAFVNI
ncbi:MAG: hypothetical protein PHS80_03665, partial [Methanothrix sp.]|nr:hypothetical protein [Methanothrix sp.]